MNILVIDIGTSSMRGILFDTGGKKFAVEQIKYEPVKLPDGRIEQSPFDWIISLEKICQNISKKSKRDGIEIDAIAVTAQRSAIIAIDQEGNPLTNTIMWQDRRNAEICRELEAHNACIFEKSGAQINTVFSGSRMTWIMRNCPDVMEKLYKFVNIPEYVFHYMTGHYKTDVTYGSRSHLMNIRNRKWDDQMLQIFGIREEWLCELQEPGSIVGNVTAEFAAKSGLEEGIPVITSGGDQQCAAIGQGAFREGTLSLVTGTGAFLVTAVRDIPEDFSDRLICNCSSVPEHYMIEANVLTCCSAFDWYCKNFYDWKNGEIDYGLINSSLRKMDGMVSSAMVLPYFQGRSTPKWNPDARAVFSEISLNTDRKELLKGILEGIFMEIKNNVELFSNYVKMEQMYISGGLANSSAINQMQADIYGIRLCHMEDSESTALGALIVALVSLGAYSSIEKAFEMIRNGEQRECYVPRLALHDLYENKRDQMKRLYEQIYG